MKRRIEKAKNYYLRLRADGIRVPKARNILKASSDKNSLLEVIKNGEKGLIISLFSQILEMNKIALKNNLPFYPKLDNFIFEKEKLYFNNFFLPFDRPSFIKETQRRKMALKLIYFGLVQKIIIPAKTIISLRPDLKNEIIKDSISFCRHYDGNELKKDVGRMLTDNNRFEISCRTKDKKEIEVGYEMLYYFDPETKIIALSRENLWTFFLLYKDIEICSKSQVMFKGRYNF